MGLELLALSAREGYALVRAEGGLAIVCHSRQDTVPVMDVRRLFESDAGLVPQSEPERVELPELVLRLRESYWTSWVAEAIADIAQVGTQFSSRVIDHLVTSSNELLTRARDANDGLRGVRGAVAQAMLDLLGTNEWAVIARMFARVHPERHSGLAEAIQESVCNLLAHADQGGAHALICTWFGKNAEHLMLIGGALTRAGCNTEAQGAYERAASLSKEPSLYGQALLAHANANLANLRAPGWGPSVADAVEVTREELDWFASRYDALRGEAKGGGRTSRMHILANTLCQWLKQAAVNQTMLVDLFARGGPGDRVVALTCCDGAPHAAPPGIIVDGILTPLSGFEQWRALIAALVVVGEFGPEVSEPCVDAIHRQQDDPGSMLNEPTDGSRRALIKQIEEPFVRKIGMSGGNAGKLAREWIRAGRENRHSGREVLLLGSDPSRRHVEVARHLGERLAAHGWRLLASDGANVGRSAIEGFLSVRNVRADARLVTGPTTFVRARFGVAISGDATVEDECRRARRRGISILPLAFSGGAAEALEAEAREEFLAQGIPSEFLDLLKSTATAARSTECAVRVLNLLARPATPAGAGTLRESGT